LLTFNEASDSSGGGFTFKEIKERVGIEHGELTRTLLSLASGKVKVLILLLLLLLLPLSNLLKHQESRRQKKLKLMREIYLLSTKVSFVRLIRSINKYHC